MISQFMNQNIDSESKDSSSSEKSISIVSLITNSDDELIEIENPSHIMVNNYIDNTVNSIVHSDEMKYSTLLVDFNIIQKLY